MLSKLTRILVQCTGPLKFVLVIGWLTVAEQTVMRAGEADMTQALASFVQPSMRPGMEPMA